MANGIGQSFQPGQSEDLRRGINRRAGTLSPMANEAIRILSLRLPQVLAGRPPAAAEMLRPRVGGAGPSGMPPAPPTAAAPSVASPGGGLAAMAASALGPPQASGGPPQMPRAGVPPLNPIPTPPQGPPSFGPPPSAPPSFTMPGPRGPNPDLDTPVPGAGGGQPAPPDLPTFDEWVARRSQPASGGIDPGLLDAILQMF